LSVTGAPLSVVKVFLDSITLSPPDYLHLIGVKSAAESM
jgi:hypothetical protein